MRNDESYRAVMMIATLPRAVLHCSRAFHRFHTVRILLIVPFAYSTVFDRLGWRTIPFAYF
jgi:hypothetical protein